MVEEQLVFDWFLIAKFKDRIWFKNKFGRMLVAEYEIWAVGKSDGKREAKSHQNRLQNWGLGGTRSDFLCFGEASENVDFLMILGWAQVDQQFQIFDLFGEIQR